MSLWSEVTTAHIWLRMVAVAGAYGLLFLLAETTRRKLGASGETTRKLVHVSGGLLALALPYVLESPWQVVGLAAGFVVLLVATGRFGGLPSIHAISRPSAGAYLYPIAIAATFTLARDDRLGYVVALLALTLGDAAAGLFGQRYGRRGFSVWGQSRTIEGSLAAFAFTVGATLAVLSLSSQGPSAVVATALEVGLVVALIEAASPWGSDNLTVPLAALAVYTAAGSGPLALLVLTGSAALLAAGLAASRRTGPEPHLDASNGVPLEGSRGP